MFQSFLIFFIIFILIISWVYYFSDSWEPTGLEDDFSIYLSWALERNTPRYNVVFETSDFKIEKTLSDKEFIKSLNTPEKYSPELFSYIQKDSNEHTPGWKFWNSINWENQVWWIDLFWDSSCDRWLIYDPCLVLDDPIRSSWGLKFWSAKNYN